MTEPLSNPFATRYTRPGAIEYRWPAGNSPAELIARLQALSWRGEIAGPHGSGKSTLLAALAPALEASGRQVMTFTLAEGMRRLPGGNAQLSKAGPTTIVIVDGYEQLSGWSRWMLRSACRRRRSGLLVTTHRPTGLPRLLTTSVEPDVAIQIVSQLVGPGGSVRPEEVLPALEASRGNLREALFHLYDLFEQRRPAPAAPTAD